MSVEEECEPSRQRSAHYLPVFYLTNPFSFLVWCFSSFLLMLLFR